MNLEDSLDCALDVILTWLCEIVRVDRKSSAFDADNLSVLTVSILQVLLFAGRVVIREEPQEILGLQRCGADNDPQLGTALADLL